MNHKYLSLYVKFKRDFFKFTLLLLIIFLIMTTGCFLERPQISYDFESYLSGDTAFEKTVAKVIPSKVELTDAKVVYYMYYDDVNPYDSLLSYNMICLSVEFPNKNFIDATQKMKELSKEYYNDIDGSHFYYNGVLYEGLHFYDDEYEGYYALAYHICSDSNTISYIAFSSEDLISMDVESALKCFPYFKVENQIVSYE